MTIKLIRSQRGSGTIIAFFVLLLLSVLGVSYMSLSSQSLLVATRESLHAQAFSIAEAGVEKAIGYLMAGGPGGEEATLWRTKYGAGSNSPLTETFGNLSYSVTVQDGVTGGICNGRVIITSTGTATEGSRSASEKITVTVKLKRENVNIWNNVIFGGVGQAGKSINGNVSMRGSIHLLGDGEDFTDLDGDGRWDSGEPYTDANGNGQYDEGEPFMDVDLDGHRDPREPFVDVNGNGTRDPALTVTDMASEVSGTADMGNNYDGMPANLRALLPPMPQDVYGGETVDTLDAKLRVKHGKVNISGTASVGFANVVGNSVKETMDGCYVNDGWGGNKGSSAVYADNGTGNGYDLGDGVVDMPIIDYGAVTIGGVTYGNYLQYLRSNSTIVTGSLQISNGAAKTISGPSGSLTIDAAGNMTVSGIVFIDGNIDIGPKQTTITYEGKGTLVTTGSMFIHANILPKTNFPRNDALGLIAADRIELANGPGDSQLTMAVAAYAQHKVICPKQTSFAGTIVGSYYEVQNVPRFYQVPELADNLPPGMPGGDPIWVISIVQESWQQN